MRVRFLLVLLLLAFGVADLRAAELDDYYLNRFASISPRVATTVGMQVVTEPNVGERCLTMLFHGLRRDWAKLLPSTRQALERYLPTIPALTDEAVYLTPHFSLHYAGSGTDAPPLTDLDADGTPDWVETIGSTMETVYTQEVTTLGFSAPPLTSARYDIYLQNVSTTMGALGITFSDTMASGRGAGSYTSYIVLDNDFAEYADTYSALQLMQVTAAHEFQHAIQFGYNLYFEAWYAEATATWIEDEVFDSINQLYEYLPPTLRRTTLSLDAAVNVSTGGGYGRWLINRQIAEQTGQSMDLVRQIWARLESIAPPADESDINSVAIINERLVAAGSSFATTFVAYVKNLYQHAWVSHQNTADQLAVANLAPTPTVTVSRYPASGQVSAPAPSLQHLASVWYRYVPGTAPPATLVISTAAVPSGITPVALVKYVTGSVSEVLPVNGTFTVSGFDAGTITEVMLVLINAGLQNVAAVPVVSIPDAGGSGGGGGGCFIATAAYGSYLHPKVQKLRDFRDRYLMHNRVGRAFVAWYYRWSPAVAGVIAHQPVLRLGCRWLLTPVVYWVEYPLAGFGGLLCLVGSGVVWRRRRMA